MDLGLLKEFIFIYHFDLWNGTVQRKQIYEATHIGFIIKDEKGQGEIEALSAWKSAVLALPTAHHIDVFTKESWM